MRKVKGDDDGCFAAALAAVLEFGGVLEHPAYSAAWPHFGLAKPLTEGGWQRDIRGGWTCHLEQGNYGHRARKATWLYAKTPAPPSIRWGASAAKIRLDAGYHSREERQRAVRPPTGMTFAQRAARKEWLREYAEKTGKVYLCPEQMGKAERSRTPIAFRDLLLAIARGSILAAANPPDVADGPGKKP